MKLLILYTLFIAMMVGVLFLNRHKSYKIEKFSEIQTNDTARQFLNIWDPKKANYDTAEINKGLLICRNEMFVMGNEGTAEKVIKIASFLIRKFHQNLGNPKPFIFKLSPLQQYHALLNHESELYCTQYSALFSFFCRINNITTRQIESYGKHDRHIFNEVYLPENRQWAYVDLTHNILFIKDSLKYLSLTEVYRNLQYENQTHLKALSLSNDTVELKPFVNVKENLRYNFDNRCVFYFLKEVDFKKTQAPLSRISRYLLNDDWYFYYSNITMSTKWFYGKYGVMFLILLALANIIRIITKRQVSNRKSN